MLKIVALFFGCLFMLIPCAAQEIEGSGKSGSSVFSPADYLQLTTPITDHMAVNTYGFYLGNVRAGIALLEVPLTLQKHFMITPSCLFVDVSPNGFTLLTGASASESYRENQFRLAGTAMTSWHRFTISDRNMYVRRFTPTGEVNRYRNRLYIAHPLSLGSYKVTPFWFDEVYHDFQSGSWLRRNWVVAAVDMPMNQHLTFQPSYIRQDDRFLRSVNFLGVALIIKTDKLFQHHRAAYGQPSSDKTAAELGGLNVGQDDRLQ
jgi:Protein of unknown function (DUF2490)